MARYDVFAGAVEGSFLLDVQTDLLDHLNTRVVVPLLPLGGGAAAGAKAQSGLRDRRHARWSWRRT